MRQVPCGRSSIEVVPGDKSNCFQVEVAFEEVLLPIPLPVP